MTDAPLSGWPRSDGRKGIRNVVAVAYLVECAHFVAHEVTLAFRGQPVHLVGFPGCYPNAYADKVMRRLLTHPNVGAVLLVSLGCEGFNREQLRRTIAASGRPVDLLVIQQSGGTTRTLNAGLDIVRKMRAELAKQTQVPMAFDELIVGTVCGGSDGTSGITANPAVGRCFDWLIDFKQTLTAKDYGILHLRFVEGQTFDEIAGTLGLCEKTIRLRLFKILTAARTFKEKYQ